MYRNLYNIMLRILYVCISNILLILEFHDLTKERINSYQILPFKSMLIASFKITHPCLLNFQILNEGRENREKKMRKRTLFNLFVYIFITLFILFLYIYMRGVRQPHIIYYTSRRFTAASLRFTAPKMTGTEISVITD